MRRNFFVKFRRPGGSEESRILSSGSARDAAREMREKYRGVVITAIAPVDRGGSAAERRG